MALQDALVPSGLLAVKGTPGAKGSWIFLAFIDNIKKPTSAEIILLSDIHEYHSAP